MPSTRSTSAMQPTRRGWVVLAVGGVLCSLSVLLESTLYLVGAVGVGAWVLADAVAFARTIGRAPTDVDVTVMLSPSTVRERHPVELVVDLAGGRSLRNATRVELDPPLAASPVDGDQRRALEESTDSVSMTASYEFDVTGRFDFDPPVVTFESDRALFAERLALGDPVTCTVEPRTPSDVAVGERGNRISLGVGEHDAQIGGSSFTPGDLRAYNAGDPRARIDWKTTARLGEPYVRDYEAAGELETLLFFDHRAATGVGVAGERALDYLRSVALWLVDRAADRGDPIGLATLGDTAPTSRTHPGSQTTQYRTLRTRLYDLEPTRGGSTRRRPASIGRPDVAPTGDTDFDRVLSAFAERPTGRVGDGIDDPLFESIRTTVDRTRGDPWVVVFTTDAHPRELARAVRATRSRAAHVTVFVAPTSLFEPGSLATLDDAYGRYEAFERFRRTLVGEGVDAYEVVPGERVDAVLASARRPRGATE